MAIPIKDEPRGLIPCGRILSTHEYLATATAAIYPGDAVKMSPSGKVLAASAASTQLVGVAASYKKSTGTTVLVYDDPDQQYFIQDDATGSTVLTTTHIGLNFDLLATAGNGTLLKSQHELARGGAAGTATTDTAQLRLLGIVSVTGANALYRVVINEHLFAKKLTGAV